MTNNKRKLVNDDNVISGDLKKKIKTSYNDVSDSNALILPTKKTKSENKNKEVNTTTLSKKERKKLEKIKKAKDEKLIVNDVYAELQLFHNLKPEDAIKSLVEDVKNDTIKTRNNLSTKVKPVSKRKYKRWMKQPTLSVEIENTASPDTSDFSSDDESKEEIINTKEEPIVSTIETSNNSNSQGRVDEKLLAEPVKNVEAEIELKIKVPISSVPKNFVLVDRPKEVRDARNELPILSEETTIMEAINENDIVIISGETGCGKTTQVPQFLYEAGFTKNGYKIGITEPRRIAAISVAERVKYELASQNSSLVAYQVRYQNTSNCGTQIKFMTDGILMQEMKKDTLVQSYSAIIIDEAHERTVYSDILIGLLTMVVRNRRKNYEKAIKLPTTNGIPPRPLKLIIMSATMDNKVFLENKKLFPGNIRPPVIELKGRLFPIQVHFNKHTRTNYLEEAFKMIYKVHNESIEGGILVFVTGQQDCLTLCKWLKKAFPVTQKFLTKIEKEQTTGKTSTNKLHKLNKNQKEAKLIKVNLTDFSIIPIDEEAELNVEDGYDERSEEEEQSFDDDDNGLNFNDIISGLYSNNNCVNPVYALPLYSLLDKSRQDLVFQPPPPGQRLVVIATNVAETSITIPNIKYVIDTGIEKVKTWDKVTGMSKFKLERISKSSAKQRAGRAGRTGPGQCFRLYSSAVYEEFKEYSSPEILTRPVEDVVLLLKNYYPSYIPIHQYCLPTIPEPLAIENAERMLINIGALKRIKSGSKDLSEITDMGKSMAQIPLNPRFARMLLLSNQNNLLPYAVLVASILSVPDFFTNNASSLTSDDTSQANIVAVNFKRESIKKRADLMFGDITVLLASFCKLENFSLRSEDEAKQAAEACGVRWKAFCEVRKLRQQLTDILVSNVKDLDLPVSVLVRPSNEDFEQLRQLILSGSSQNVAVVAPTNICSGSTTQDRRKAKGMYLSCSLVGPVYIHSQSVLCREKFQWVVYQNVYETVPHGESSAKPFMRNLSVIEPQWLPLLCPLECQVEGLLLDNKQDVEKRPIYDHNHDRLMAMAKKITYGSRGLELPSGIRIPVIYEIMEDEVKQGDLFRRWIAKFFLQGVLFKTMELWTSKFKSTCNPELLLANFANTRPEIINLMKEISKLEFPSKRAIREEWKKDGQYLLKAYLDWIRPDDRESVTMAWPPVDIE